MRKTLLSLAVASLSCLPVASQAAEISYSFVEAAYVNTDVDDFDETLDGFALGGSFEVVENVFLYASYSDQSTDLFGADVDVTGYSIGGGYALPLSDTLDVVGTIGYVSSEFEASYEGESGSFDDDGYELGIALKALPMEQLELSGGITYVDLSDSGDDTALGIGARWYFVPQFAVGALASFTDDSNSYGLSVRWDLAETDPAR